jgi:hypothetical protein
MLAEHPESFHTLLLKSLKKIQRCLDYDLRSSSENADASSAGASPLKGGPSEDAARQAMNAVRILTRVLPVALGVAADTSSDADNNLKARVEAYFWDPNCFNLSSSYGQTLIAR